SCTSTTMRGSSSGRFGCREVIHDTTWPRPLDTAASLESDPQVPHIGAGGCRRVPQSVHRWIRRFHSTAPSQKKASSTDARRGSLIAPLCHAGQPFLVLDSVRLVR